MSVLQAREEIRAKVARAQHQGPDARLAAASLASMFNRYAPVELQIPTVATTEMTISTDLALTARRKAVIERGVTRAVAWLGHSLMRPGVDLKVLRDPQLERTELVTRETSQGLVISPAPSENFPLFEDMGFQVTSIDLALARLVNILPASEGDESIESRLIELPPVERRAVAEIVRAAKPLDGIRAHVSGQENGDGVMTADQADDLGRLLGNLRTPEPVKIKIAGRLEGARFGRQRFYIDGDDSRSYEGTIDASMVLRVRRLIDQQVNATLLRTIPVDGAGRTRPPVYLLIDVEATPGLFG